VLACAQAMTVAVREWRFGQRVSREKSIEAAERKGAILVPLFALSFLPYLLCLSVLTVVTD